MLRAASVGIGWWSNELAASVQGDSDKIRIVTCHSRSAERRQDFAKKFDTGNHETYEAVLADPDVDAVILTTPHSLHAEHVIQAADAGKHVFVEKPFTLTAESGRIAAARCRERGVVLAVGHNRRFCSAAIRVKDMLDAGGFGTMLHLEANFSSQGALAYTPDRWRAQRSECPGGALAPLGIHMIDLLTWLGGPVRRLTAFSERRVSPVDIDDTTTSLMAFASGGTGYLATHFACPYTSTLNLYGTEGNAFAGIDGNTLTVQRSGEQPTDIELELVDTLRSELEEFADACAGATEFRVRSEEAIHNVAIMEAIVQSAAQQAMPVEIP
ncbi:MAG: Gfo/Idh/MocA family oxidoreductase [Alphaproteobacteria bacterium]|nr:Gfo/Idh/MocA family oxidoreductase [Alphaproteobacteria bacterium]